MERHGLMKVNYNNRIADEPLLNFWSRFVPKETTM